MDNAATLAKWWRLDAKKKQKNTRANKYEPEIV